MCTLCESGGKCGRVSVVRFSAAISAAFGTTDGAQDAATVTASY